MHPLYLAIPVMTHKESEIEAFLEAKDRLEKKSEHSSTPIKVGVFLYYPSPAQLTPEVRSKQLENQMKFKLPIYCVQGHVFFTNSLAFAEEEAAKFPHLKSNIEALITHSAAMKDLAPKNPFPGKLAVEVHPGVVVYEDLCAFDKTTPCVYSVEEFQAKKDRLLEIMKNRYAQLSALGRTVGVEFGIENGHSVTVEMHRGMPNVSRVQFTPFNELSYLRQIAGVQEGSHKRYLTFDVAHQGTAYMAIDCLVKNGALSSVDALKTLYPGYLEKDFDKAFGSVQDKLNDANVIHLSNVSGIGVCLPESYDAVWGKDGTAEGRYSKEELRNVLDYARSNQLPVALEVDYDVKNIPINKFKEVDHFLAHIGLLKN